MAERGLNAPDRLSAADRRLLLAAKVFVLLVIAGVLASGKDRMWPLINWPMFSTYGDRPPAETTSTVQMHVVTADGQTIILWDKDLSGRMPSGDGIRAAQLPFNLEDPAQRRATALALWARVGVLLPGIPVSELQVWKVTWNGVDGRRTPPFDAQQPDERMLIGTIRAADFEDGA